MSGDHDEGLATILAAAVIAGLLTFTMLGVYLGSAVLTRHRTSAAADMAALAAASQAVAGTEYACLRAGWVAEQSKVRLTACRIQGWEAFVAVTGQPTGWLAVFGATSAHARAGPAEVSESGEPAGAR